MTAYALGQWFTFIPAATNTGAATLNITPSGASALGAKNIYQSGNPLTGGEIIANVPAYVYYDGTQFNIIGSISSGNFLREITKYKASNQTITSSTTIVDDNDLQFSIAANEVWVALLEIDAGANLGTTGIQVQVTVPTSATLSFKPSVQPDVIATTGTYARVTGTSGATLDFGTTNLPGAGEVVIRAIIYVANSTNAGTVKFRWGPSTNTGTALALRAGSSLFARRVA